MSTKVLGIAGVDTDTHKLLRVVAAKANVTQAEALKMALELLNKKLKER